MQMILHPKSFFLYIFCVVCVSRIFSQMAIKKLKKLDFTTRLTSIRQFLVSKHLVNRKTAWGTPDKKEDEGHHSPQTIMRSGDRPADHY